MGEWGAEHPDYLWPIFIDGVPVDLQPGDAAIYKGLELDHWREAFMGEDQAQAFLFFVDRDGPYGRVAKYDCRPMLGHSRDSRDPNLWRMASFLNDRIHGSSYVDVKVIEANGGDRSD